MNDLEEQARHMDPDLIRRIVEAALLASPHSRSCSSMLCLIKCIGTWPGPSIITCTSCCHATCVSSPSVASSPICASSFASWIDPGRSPSPSENATSYAFMISQMSSKCV